jgi:hypothetical protein
MREWQWHTDGTHCAAAETLAGLLVVRVADAVATALRLDDHRVALPAAAAAIRDHACTVRDVDAAVAACGVRSPGRARQLAAWRELKRVILESDAAHP